jgi:hypothetical protein
VFICIPATAGYLRRRRRRHEFPDDEMSMKIDVRWGR